MAFSSVLSDLHEIDVGEAFKTWLREQSVFPTPAQIRTIALENGKIRLAGAKKSAKASLWTQVIRTKPQGWPRVEGRILEENPKDNALSTCELDAKYGAGCYRESWAKA